MRTAVGRYRVTGLLGEGGMGVVYDAHDGQLDRPVAIKMLRAARADAQACERLRREARAAARVSHPHICQLYEIGDESGEIFLAMERLAGESLDERIARGPLPASEALQHMLAILSALGAIHRTGLVHRDLKPSNVFLTPTGVKLLDFGVARAIDADGTRTEADLTQPGVLVGTPRFASPEQVTGGPIDGRSDLFAAGGLLFYMLAGKPMFDGRTAAQLLQAIEREPPPVLGGSTIVTAADRIIQRAVAKDPRDRYQTGDEMTIDVRSAMLLGDDRGPVSAVRMTRLIVLPFRVLRPDPETDFLAFSLPDAVTTSLSGLGSLVVRSSATASQVATQARDLEEIAARVDVDIVLTGTLLRAGDQVRVTSQLVEAQGGTVLWSDTAQITLGDVFRLQDDLARRIVESLAVPLTARDRRAFGKDVPASAKAYELYLRGNQLSDQARNWAQARDAYRDCLERDPRFAPAWARLGRIYRVLGLYGGARAAECYAQAEEAFQRALHINPDLPVAHNLYTNLEVEMGRAREAMVRLLRRTADNPADPELFAGLAQACRYCDLLEASVAASERARRLDAGIKTSVAHSYLALGEYQKAIETSVDDPPFPKAFALALLGRTAEALETLASSEAAGLPTAAQRYVVALRAAIAGDREAACEATGRILQMGRLRDPCAIFYLARQLALCGDPRAVAELRRAVEGGFGCYTLLSRDPWLDSVRGNPAFGEIVQLARERRAAAAADFEAAGGTRLLALVTG